MQAQRLFIVDAMALAFRSFYAFSMGRPLTTSAGKPVSAVFGSALFMHKLITEQKPDYLVVASDSREPTFRHALYPEYKANRNEMPPELAAQLPHFFQLMEAYGCPVLRTPGLEADDLIGTVAKRFAGSNLKVFIVSGDKDFMQLINDDVFVYTPRKGDDATIVDRAGVHAKFGCSPEQVIDCLALIGDSSDNIPGVHGIGPKGAAKLIEAYGSLSGIYANIDAVANKKLRDGLREGQATAFLSQQLVTIKTDAEVPYTLADFACAGERAVYNERLLKVCQELEFTSMAAKIATVLGPPAAPSTQAQAPASSGATGSATTSGGMKLLFADPEANDPVVGGPQSLPGQTTSIPAPNAPQRAAAEVPGYHLVRTKEQLANLLQQLSKAEVFAFDTETTGLNIVSDRPIGISLAVKSGEAHYVPLVAQHLDDLTAAEVVAQLGPILSSGRTKIGHNLKYDLQMLAHLGIKTGGSFIDTMICDWLLDVSSRQHGLDACCLRHLNYEKIPTKSLIGEQGQLPMLAADLGELTRYACEDADLTLRLYQDLLPKLKDQGLDGVLRDVDMPLVPILARMEATGVHIDTAELTKLSSNLTTAAEGLTEEIHTLAGEPFNINSPKQLNDILFTKLRIHEQLGIKSLKKTKHGYSTDESVLQRLTAHPLANKILEYREVAKLQSTYALALPALIQPATGRLHTSFHQTGTATGRLSSSAPNLQNIPIRSALGREVRKAFTAKDPNWVLISADYSQIELRLMAHMAQDAGLIAAFASGEDIHTSTAAAVFGIAKDAVDQTMRSRAKAINFGIIYGMGARRLALETGATLAEATAFIDRYFASYPGINRFVEATVKEARTTGYTRTISGRRRSVLGLGESNQRLVASAENIAVNTRIQGSAADLIKLAMTTVERKLQSSGGLTRMLLQVHDELVFEGPRSEVEKASALIKDSMEKAMDLSVPLVAQIGFGNNWLEAH